jgi:signal transduction histidine kinase/ligand-binding sensor domain-containing protein
MRSSSICTSAGAAKVFRAVLVAATALAFATRADAQSQAPFEAFRAKHWSTANGLPQNTPNDFLQGAEGELWIATFGGLLRFDGLEFKVFDLDALPGLPSNRITALAGDGGDGLWLATQTAYLVHFVGGRVTEARHAPDDVTDILSLVHARDGSLWTQAGNGAVQRNDGAQWTLLVPPGEEGHYEGVRAHPDGSIGAAVGADLVTFDASGKRIATRRAPSRILALAPCSAGGWWIGLPDGLARSSSPVDDIRREPIVSRRVTAIVEDGESSLWLGTPFGPSHVLLGATQFSRAAVLSNDPLPGEFDVRSLYRDGEANVWIGSNGQGLVRLRRQRVALLGPLESRVGVSALADDGEGGAWIGGACSGLSHRRAGDGSVREVEIAETTTEPTCVQSLLRDHRGRIWLGWDDRVLRSDVSAEGSFAPILGERRFSPSVGAMVEVEGGDVWIATHGGHLVRVGNDDAVAEELDAPHEIVSLAGARDGSLWIGGSDRVMHFSAGRWEIFDGAVGMPRGDVRDLCLDDDGTVWIATYGGGLGRLADGRAVTLSRAQGLPDNSLSRILDDGQGRLWLLANLGLLVVDRGELIAVAEHRKASIDPVVLGPEAGMVEGNFGSPAGFRAANGNLWFGTIAGAVRIDPREFPFNRVPPHARIERIETDGSTLAPSDAVEIPPGTRHVVVRFTAFALSAPERVHFRYRLDGFDADWIDVGGDHGASYTSIAPGPYTFRVEARNEDGVWSEEPAVLRVEVLPRWWQTLSFRIAAVLAASAALITWHQLRIARVRRRAEVLLQATEARARAEERESRLREVLAHAGRASTAGELATSLAHEVNQPLAAIVANAQAGRRFLAREPFERADLDEILRDIAREGQRASEVIRRLREFLRKNTATRRELDANQVVRDTLPLVRRELEENHVRLELALDPGVPAIEADRVQLQQVIVNLVKNACEAMADQSGNRCVTLRTSSRAARVQVEVRDTGPGLAPEVSQRLFEPYVTTKPSGMGLGLAICRTIVEAHAGRLSGGPAPGGGVVFSIDLPARTNGEGAR